MKERSEIDEKEGKPEHMLIWMVFFVVSLIVRIIFGLFFFLFHYLLAGQSEVFYCFSE